jgi:hypothetical protein
MVRKEIKQGAIEIAYGSDHMTGYFLSVYDKRLSYKTGISPAALSIIEKVNPDQGGAYFDLHTADFGFGQKVDKPTLIYFWRAYGIPEQDIEKVNKGQQLVGSVLYNQ